MSTMFKAVGLVSVTIALVACGGESESKSSIQSTTPNASSPPMSTTSDSAFTTETWTDGRRTVIFQNGVMSIRENGVQAEELKYAIVDANTIRIDSWKTATSTATINAPPAPIAPPESIRVEEGNLLVVDKGVIRRGKTDYLWNEPAFAAKKSRDNSGQVMRKFAQIMDQQRMSLNEQWPTDFKHAIKLSDGTLSAEMLISASNTAIPNHYLYVRPSSTGKSTQPMILENPELNKGAGSVVVYCDCHVGWVDGDALWKEATRLAALPKSRKDGIDLSDWTVPTYKP